MDILNDLINKTLKEAKSLGEKVTGGGPCTCRKYVTDSDGSSKCVKWDPAGCGDTIPMKKEKEIKKITKEAIVTADNTKFQLRTGVNKNPTKLGIKIQFEPQSGTLDSELKGKLEVALQEKLNISLADYDIQVSKDTDVPRDEVIGFFIPLSQLKNLIVTALTGKSSPKPTVPAPTPIAPRRPAARPTPPTTSVDEMIQTEIINEMRIRDLNEISQVVSKEDFYEFINKGNNILRTLEENGRSVAEAKKYLKYLVAHNIM